MSSNPQEMIIYYVVAYTKWTHTYLIQTFTSKDIEFVQREERNEEVYSKFKVKTSVEYFNELKELINGNTDLSFNIEYGDY
jgi:hypothetical protein